MSEKWKNDEKGKNEDALISIRLRDLEFGTTTAAFAPEDRITGEVSIMPHRDIHCRGVEIAIGWYTEGKGRREEDYPYREQYAISKLEQDMPFREKFSFTLPAGPWSYNGHYITIVWAVKVKIDIPMAPDYNDELRFVLQPAAL